MAHYDSIPMSPGAGDDAAGIAILLETLRALKAGPLLNNDLIVLFTDGEEQGVDGASGFLKHPWKKEVRLAMNWDSVDFGPMVMWRTSPENGWLIRELARSKTRVVVAPQLFFRKELIAGDSDFSPLMRAGISGYDFSTVYASPANHSMNDTIKVIDPGTIQYAGDTVLALTRHFGQTDLGQIRKAPNLIYFNVSSWLIAYPFTWVIPSAILALLLLIGVLILGFLRKQLTWKGLSGAFAFELGAMVVFSLLWKVIWQMIDGYPFYDIFPSIWRSILSMGHANRYRVPAGEFYFMASFLVLTVILFSLSYYLVRKKINPFNMAFGSLIPLSFLLVLTSLTAPAISHLMIWPVLFVLVALGCNLMDTRGWLLSQWWARWVIGLFAITPILLLWVPAVYSLFLATGMGFLMVNIAATVLVLGVVVSQFDLMLGTTHPLDSDNG
jgi:hypothetical protein